MDILSPALDWIAPRAPFGRADHFTHAYLDGQCPLCHIPFQEVMVKNSCPHWLIRSGRNAKRMVPPFAAFGLEGVLYFLLQCIDAERWRSPKRASAELSGDNAFLYLDLQLRQHGWRFQLPRPQAGLSRFSVTFLHVQSKRSYTYQVVGLASDQALIDALAGWADDTGKPAAPDLHQLSGRIGADPMAYHWPCQPTH